MIGNNIVFTCRRPITAGVVISGRINIKREFTGTHFNVGEKVGDLWHAAGTISHNKE